MTTLTPERVAYLTCDCETEPFGLSYPVTKAELRCLLDGGVAANTMVEVLSRPEVVMLVGVTQFDALRKALGGER